MADDELPPDTIIIEPMGPFLGIVDIRHTPDSIAVKLDLIDSRDTKRRGRDKKCRGDIADDPNTE